MKILSEKPLTLSEVKNILQSIEKSFSLSYSEKKTLEFLNKLQVLSSEEAKKLKEELVSLNFPELSESIIVKIVDILPKNMDDLRAILYGLSLDKEKAEKVLEIVKKYS